MCCIVCSKWFTIFEVMDYLELWNAKIEEQIVCSKISGRNSSQFFSLMSFNPSSVCPKFEIITNVMFMSRKYYTPAWEAWSNSIAVAQRYFVHFPRIIPSQLLNILRKLVLGAVELVKFHQLGSQKEICNMSSKSTFLWIKVVVLHFCC